MGPRWPQPLRLQHRRQDLHAFGEPYQLGWGDYRGDRIGIFTYNNKGEAGHIDCDSFVYRYDSALTR